MKEKLELRVKELKAEFETGQKQLVELEAKEVNLRNTLIRISGAIQVLDEVLSKESGNDNQSSEKEIEQLEEAMAK